MGALDRLALSFLPAIPTPVMRRLAGRYIAGERLDEAVARLKSLRDRGHPGIIDLLGENVTTEASARAVVAQYAEASAAVAREGLDAYVSVKPTHVGLAFSVDLALELYTELAEVTAANGQRLRVEMEDHPTTDATLRVFERLRESFNHVGVVLQSRLFRTPDDVAALAPGALDVRLVKGIYLEPAELAHTEYAPIRAAYVDLARALLDRGAFAAFATHDEHLAEELFALVRERGLGPDRYELQVLLGVREPLWEQWKAAGHTVRVYVPYGPEWRAYSQRRLKKNPQIFRHVVRDTLTFWKP